MSNKCVTVLAPNGRRQNVKVTPNTTVLQVLEEVCQKQGFKPEEYDIRHHNKVVDATAPLRFTGLPNNAQLEMALATRMRFESNVKVGLTLENGERLLGEFEPSENLWGIVTSLCPSEAENEGIPAVVYMGREVNGETNLQETTLRSLGLTKGGAVLRYFKRSPGHVNQQANVSAPLRKLPPANTDYPKKKHVSVMQPAMQTIIPPDPSGNLPTGQSEENVQPSASIQEKDGDHSLVQSNEKSITPDPFHQSQSASGKIETESEDTANVETSENLSKSESLSEMDYEDSSMATTSAESVEFKKPLKEERLDKQCKEEDENIVFLGERSAVVFNLSSVSGTVQDVPDDFFDLTLDDARQLLRDHKRRQAELEEAPLLTTQQRDLEKSKLLLNQLHHYRRCVVRVQFPDRLVLQGMFSPLDSFNSVMDFVRKFLQYPEAEFHLFVTPPKTVLSPEQTLVGAGCVPCTLVHFGYSSGVYDRYLRDDIAQRITSPRGAAIAALKARGLAVRPVSAPVVSTREGASQTASGPSNSTSVSTRPTQTSSDSGPISGSSSSAVKRPATDKFPKWFRPGK